MWRCIIAVCFGLMVLAVAPAAEARRLALLIGNQAYTREVGLLRNPIKDVELVAASLKQIGFAEGDITIIRDADRTTILEAVDSYADRLAQAGDEAVGFFYYSGHGAANNRDRRNYLIPVGVEGFDRRVWYNAVALDDITGKLNTRAPNAAHFVIFDACRNVLNAPTKGAKGFVPAQRLRGMLIAFSTEPGEIASDEGQNSGPYAAALAAELATPGLHHLDLFQNVKERVYRKTGVQVPWTRNGMLQRVFLAGEPEVPEPPLSDAARAFQIAKDTDSPAALRAFARRYKDTVFADMALAMAETSGRKPAEPTKPQKPEPSKHDEQKAKEEQRRIAEEEAKQKAEKEQRSIIIKIQQQLKQMGCYKGAID
ncbi:MAG: caspase family protein, partial [Pseudomonadota bacterium]